MSRYEEVDEIAVFFDRSEDMFRAVSRSTGAVGWGATYERAARACAEKSQDEGSVRWCADGQVKLGGAD